MKILLLTQQLAAYRSGVGTYAMSLLEGLQQRAHNLTVALPQDQVTHVPGVRLIPVRPGPFDPTPGKWFSLGVKFARLVADIHKEFEIIHFIDAREAWCTGKLDTPVTAMANDAYALEWISPSYPRSLYTDRLVRCLYYFALRHIEKSAYQRFDLLMANSWYVGNIISSGYELTPGHVKVVHYGLSHPSVDGEIPLRGQPALLFIGGNFLRKGLPQLITATAALAQRFPNIHLHVVGKDRNQPTLQKLAIQQKIADKIIFHGWQPNDIVRRMLKGADIFVLPSLTEGFGLVYLEAMQIGTPVIATRAGGARELFHENREAILVAPGSVDELISAIEKITTDKSFADSLVKNGRLAAAELTPLRMAMKTEELWIELLNNA